MILVHTHFFYFDNRLGWSKYASPTQEMYFPGPGWPQNKKKVSCVTMGHRDSSKNSIFSWFSRPAVSRECVSFNTIQKEKCLVWPHPDAWELFRSPGRRVLHAPPGRLPVNQISAREWMWVSWWMIHHWDNSRLESRYRSPRPRMTCFGYLDAQKPFGGARETSETVLGRYSITLPLSWGLPQRALWTSTNSRHPRKSTD